MATQPVITNVAWSTTVAGQALLTYNTSVNATDAATSGNYSIPGLTVTLVTYNAGTFVATMTVTGYTFNTSYKVTVSNVRDVTNALTIAAPGNAWSFVNGSSAGQANVQPSIAEPAVHPTKTWGTSDTPFGPPGGATTFPTEGFNVGLN